MIENCVIVGGGVAGLSAANKLVDAGIKPLVIEASKYPSQRICGEFFSHECLPILNQWDISLPFEVSVGRFYKGDQKLEFELPIPSRSCSRYIFDSLLLERARNKGARILTETSLKGLTLPHSCSENYELLLSDEQVIKARHLIIGTGRIPKLQSHELPLSYAGFKGHFEGIDGNHAVEIYSFLGGYLGIANVDSKTTNIACLVKKEYMGNHENPEAFLANLLEDKGMEVLKKRLAGAKMIFPQWLFGQLPEFGIRSNPSWERVFWIGDAAGSIPPVSGEGLAIAVTSGEMAAHYYLKSNAQEFQAAWLRRYRKRFLVAQQIHKIILTPWMSNLAIRALHFFPSIPPYLWKQTRE